ncbi:MAG TPA: hypothetical protein VE825_04980 [Terriglobales bacterium]|nr:hypothetical protein [Terriglobales bacterium]
MRLTAALLFVCCCLLIACNKSEAPSSPAASTAPAAAPKPAEKVPDYEFEPLTQADVDLYLGIMREAVVKFRQLPEADKAVLAKEADYYKHLKSGWHPAPTPEEVQLFTRSDELHHLDTDIARQKGVNARYIAVREAIEGMVGPEKCGDSDCGQGPDEDDPALRKKQIEDDAKRKVIIKQDLALLKPYEAEILAMATEIRMMPGPARSAHGKKK